MHPRYSHTMDLPAIIEGLRDERGLIEQAIMSFERLAAGPPASVDETYTRHAEHGEAAARATAEGRCKADPMSAVAHIPDDELEAYGLDKLPELRLAAVEEHLLWCNRCLDRIEAIERRIAAMRNAVIRDGLNEQG